MQTARVIVDSLNVRAAPIDGSIRYQVKRGERLNVIRDLNGWLEIARAENPCWVKGSMVEIMAVPGEIRADQISIVDKAVSGPDGRFATLFKLGLYNNGKTRIAAFVNANPGLFATMPPSLISVARAVSANEGALEAINSWDNSILTFGIFQWTAGAGNAAGELPAMLARLQLEDKDAFAFYFGRYGLGLEMPATSTGLPTGQFRLDGTTLTTAAQKEALRSHIWAYRFWRAGHDPAVRKAQVGHALDRIGIFYDKTSTALKNRKLSSWINSEVGVAQLLDQHVNRPGHVLGTVGAAIDQFLAAGGNSNPANWGDAQEAALLRRYLEIRKTYGTQPMTDSQKRAEKIAESVTAGTLSAKRGSFKGF